MGKKRSKVLPFEKKAVAPFVGKASNIDISASLVSREPPLAEEDLRLAVARIVLYGAIVQSYHSANDRSYRNISDRDILVMLEGEWSLVAKPKWEERHRNWKYKLRGSDFAGDELVLILAVSVEMNRIDIITKF